MFKGNKPEAEARFELVTWGVILLVAAVCYVLFRQILPPLMLFFPGLVLMGSALFQDMQPDWHAGWPTYIVSGLAVAIGLAGTLTQLLGENISFPPFMWLVITAVELGALFVIKALYDPTPR